MSKEAITHIGPKLKDIRTGRKISRKDLAGVCHPNTLRNFEIGLNQINIDDFVKLLINLGYNDFDLLDGLATTTLEKYAEYIELADCFTLFKSMRSRNVNGIEGNVNSVCMKMKAFMQTETYNELDTVLKQDLYMMYITMSSFLEQTEEFMLTRGLELFYLSYKKGQSVFSSGEVNLMGALCQLPYPKDKFFYKICDKICDNFATKERLKRYENDFLYTYIELLYKENSRKFSASKQKLIGINPCSQFIFEAVKKS